MLKVPSHIREQSSYLEIADYIESQVVGGVLKPNDRLPNTPELLDLFDVSRDTLQRALSRLSRRGLITRVPRRGTFVSAGVASATVGLVFGKDPITSRSGFYRETLAAFMREGRNESMNMKAYLFLEESTFLSSVREMEQDIRDGKLRCLVSMYLSGLLGHWTEDLTELPCLLPPDSDVELRVQMGLSHLLERGARRPLLLSQISPGGAAHVSARVLGEEKRGAAAAWLAAGMDGSPPESVQLAEDNEAAYAVIMKHFTGPGPHPDSVLVNHDLNVNGVLYALANLGLRMPEDVKVIVHENRGCEHFCPQPLTRLVCDPTKFATATLAYIRQQGLRLAPGRQHVPGKILPHLIVGATT